MPSIPNLVERDIEKEWEEYNDSFDDPLRNNWATEGFWRLVGNGKKTDDSCGKFKGFLGCVDDSAHSFVDLNGQNFEGKAFVSLQHHSCYSYNCPVCYLSWAVRAAHRVTDKLEDLGAKFGVADHIVLSLPDECFNPETGLEEYFSSTNQSFDKLLTVVVRALKSRNIVAGYIIFHGFRYANRKEAQLKGVKFGWRWSPHFHILGFIRNKKEFYKLVPKMFLKDGFVVNLKDKRISVFGTAWYQLNHASIQYKKEHFEVARQFGDLVDEKSKKMRENSKKIKELKNNSSVESVKKIFELEEENKQLKQNVKDRVKKHKQKCPICGKPLVKLMYYGDRQIKKNLQDCKKQDKRFIDDIIDKEKQCLNWAEK